MRKDKKRLTKIWGKIGRNWEPKMLLNQKTESKDNGDNQKLIKNDGPTFAEVILG